MYINNVYKKIDYYFNWSDYKLSNQLKLIRKPY